MVETPADLRNGCKLPTRWSMESGQWSIESDRPLPSLSSAKFSVPKPSALTSRPSVLGSSKETVDDLSMVAFKSSKETVSV